MNNNIKEVIKVLQKVQAKYGDNVNVAINVCGNDTVSDLSSICIDNDMDEIQVLFETDLEQQSSNTILIYSQGEELENGDNDNNKDFI